MNKQEIMDSVGKRVVNEFGFILTITGYTNKPVVFLKDELGKDYTYCIGSPLCNALSQTVNMDHKELPGIIVIKDPVKGTIFEFDQGESDCSVMKLRIQSWKISGYVWYNSSLGWISFDKRVS